MYYPGGDTLRFFARFARSCHNSKDKTMRTTPISLQPSRNHLQSALPAVPTEGLTNEAAKVSGNDPATESVVESASESATDLQAGWATLVDALHARWRASVALAEQDQQLLWAAESWHEAEPVGNGDATLATRFAARNQAELDMSTLNQVVLQAQAALPTGALDIRPSHQGKRNPLSDR
jgi:hypothetical protein